MLNILKDEKRYSEIELDLHKKLAYEKGRANIIEEFEKIKAEIDESSFETYEKYSEEPIICNYTINVMQIIDKHIAELKGENNDA